MSQHHHKCKSSDTDKIVFQDAMDPTRFLRVKEIKQNTVICRVFFAKRGRGRVAYQNMTFTGMTEAPKSLFNFNPEKPTRYGFNAL